MTHSPGAPPQSEPPTATMAQEQCFANARIVLRDRVMTGAVHVTGDRIAAVEEGDRVPQGAMDLGGEFLLPGLVELHTDNLERHMEPRPKVGLPHVGAILAHDGEMASMGITTVFDALRVGSLHTRGEGARKYARPLASEVLALRDAGVLKVRHMIHLRAEICSETLIEELSEFTPEDRVGLVSMMDHTPGQRQFRDLSKLKVYYVRKHGYSDAEFDDLMRYRRDLGARWRAAHELATVAEALRLGAPLASHDDTTRDHVAKSGDLGITLAEFPTTIEAAEACREQGIAIILGAPNLIRGESHSGNVSAVDLARRGLLDIVSSDYVPSLLIASAFRLAALWDDLPRAIRAVSTTPAASTGLDDRGRIAPGCLADLVRVRMLDRTPVIRGVWRGAQQVG